MRPVEKVLELALRDLAAELNESPRRLQTIDSAQNSSFERANPRRSLRRFLPAVAWLCAAGLLGIFSEYSTIGEFHVIAIPVPMIVFQVLLWTGLGALAVILLGFSWRAASGLRRRVSSAWERFLFPTVN